jgi:AcrR family transcriptional regulator
MPEEPAEPARKPAGSYHHGDLRRALIRAAVETIDRDGVDAMTLRAVGETLGVSRTAPYRHFKDKAALLAAVAAEGFRTLSAQLAEAWDERGGGRPGFAAMGRAYVRFAIDHPSHYRVMFGGFTPDERSELELRDAGAGAFQVLVDALADQQAAGTVRRDDLRQQASFVWASVHGIAMLAIDRQLGPDPEAGYALAIYAVDALAMGLRSGATSLR